MKALITGASSGIGAEIAKQLSDMGYETILVARRKDRLLSLAKTLKTKAQIVEADLSDIDVLSAIPQKYPDIDILVNNAGLGVFGEFTDTAFDKESQMLDVNIRAMHFLMKKYIPLMEQSRGKILNVASSAAFFSGPLLSSYYASKAYVLKLSSAVREELRRKNVPVSITVFCPGPVKTEFGDVSGCNDGKGAMTPEEAAKKAIRGMLKGKRIVVPTFLTKCTHLIAKILPESISVRMVYNIQKAKER